MTISQVNNFNLLRLLAAAQVVYMHASWHLELAKNSLWHWVASQFSGVAVFFVISGFLVSDSYLRSNSTGSFFFKRALRIYPALILNIVVLDALMYLAGQLPNASRAGYPIYLSIYTLTASSLIAQFFTFPTYSEGFFSSYPSGVLWTLTVELCFYLAVPLFLSVASRSRALGTVIIAAAIGASFAVAFAADIQFYRDHPYLDISVVPYFWIFGLGMLTRLHWDRLAPLFEGKLLLWLLAYGAVIAIAMLHFGALGWLDYKIQPQWTGFFRIVMMGAVIISAAFSLKTLTARLHIDKADLSYGLYLWHMLVIITLSSLGYKHSAWLWTVVYGGALSLAAFSWFVVEKPALSLKSRSPSRPQLAIPNALPEEKSA